MKKTTLIIVTALTLGGIATAATVQAKRGHDGERMIERATERLELDSNQVEALRALQVEMVETRELMRGGSGGDLRSELSALVSAETFDQGRALTLINERISALQANAPELVAAAGLFLDGLDESQRTEISELTERMGKRHGHRHGDGDDSTQ